MIRTSAGQAVSGLLQRLRQRAENIAQASTQSERSRPTQPANWRSARHLWPDIFKD